MITPRDLLIGARFLRQVPSFLRHPVRADDARREIRDRLEHRERDFLALARRGIFDDARSPYRRLLELAGCTYGDLERLVGRDGVEGALQALFRAGVYLTVEEFKGRRPVKRGGVTIDVSPDLVRRPSTTFLEIRSSGSRGSGTPAPIDIDYIRERTVNTSVAIESRGGLGWSHAVWGVPGSLFMANLLELAGIGGRPARWFSQVDPASHDLPARYRWSPRVMRWGSLLAGVPLPRVEHAPLDDPTPIARWISEALRAGSVPHLLTYASSAVRLCLDAPRAGFDLRGAQFSLTGEPLTAARLGVIQRAGAGAAPWYGSMESSSIGHACVAPEAPDETHLLRDRLALIQVADVADGANGSGLPPGAILLTSLRPTALFVLLNVSFGDQAVVTERRCACPMERVGWTTHLHTIRSYEKLTAGGMTFLDADVIRVLEEVLPARHGGAPSDYQIVEDHAEDGRPDLRLLVHPRLGDLDAAAVGETLLTAIGSRSGTERLMELVWRQGRVLRVERQAPLTTATGKILHLHVRRG